MRSSELDFGDHFQILSEFLRAPESTFLFCFFLYETTQRTARFKLCFSWVVPLDDPEVTLG